MLVKAKGCKPACGVGGWSRAKCRARGAQRGEGSCGIMGQAGFMKQARGKWGMDVISPWEGFGHIVDGQPGSAGRAAIYSGARACY